MMWLSLGLPRPTDRPDRDVRRNNSLAYTPTDRSNVGDQLAHVAAVRRCFRYDYWMVFGSLSREENLRC
jgi:hypothetical protein